MADITKCNPIRCKLKDMCYRYTAKESYYQAYFTEEPCDENGTKCELFWGDGQERLMEYLRDICNHD